MPDLLHGGLHHTFPDANLVVFADSLFTGAAEYVRGTAVHELAHVIDYFNPFEGGIYIHQVVPTGTHISDYAVQNNLHLEYWAEATAIWVYGERYTQHIRGGNANALTTNQSNWIERVLTGWGW